MSVMKNIRIEKVTLNIGSGKDQNKLDKGMKVLKSITGIDSVKTLSKKRIAAWGIRIGLPIGCKITLRKEQALALLPRVLEAKDFNLKPNQFDNAGNVSFGIAEYIDIKDAKYDPQIGILGLQVCITLERPGFRINRRKIQKKKIPHKHRITKEEAMEFMASNFKVNVVEEERG